jgi:predicted DNA-binding transcriptional regulator AlpA
VKFGQYFCPRNDYVPPVTITSSRGELLTSTGSQNSTLSSLIAELLTPQRTSELTGLSQPTLQRMRSRGTGPPFVKLGPRRVAYRLSDINRWLEIRIVTSTSDARERGLST